MLPNTGLKLVGLWHNNDHIIGIAYVNCLYHSECVYRVMRWLQWVLSLLI